MIIRGINRILLAGALSILSGCGGQADDPPEIILPPYVEPTPEPSATLEPAVYSSRVARSHNYDEVEGFTYYYIAAVTEEDRKRGKAAGAVLGFNYLGRNGDGDHILASVSGSGAVNHYSRCPDKCVIIHHSDGGRSAYNPDSIIGSAFQDAIRGRLKRYVPPRPVEPTYSDPPQAAQTAQDDSTRSPSPELMNPETVSPSEIEPTGE